MTEKRLLCIVGSMNTGGAETFLMKIYRQLDRANYQMDFAVSIPQEGGYDKEILSLGGKIYHITPKTSSPINNFMDIVRIVKKNQYKSVMRISQHSLSAMELLAARIGGAQILAYRSSNSNTTSGSKKNVAVHKMCMFMPRFFANVKLAPSTEAAEFMFGKGCVKNGNAHLLHNGIDLNVYHFDKVARDNLRNELNMGEGLLVGHIGRFNQQKNHEFIIKVFAQILKINAKAKLLLVGVGELQEKIRTKAQNLGIEDSVVFIGVRSDVPQLLSAMDVFLFPSLYEGMPNTVIEAQATGLPCVVSDSITKEANITGLVQYVSLQDSEDVWADKVIRVAHSLRKDTKQDFDKCGYDIQTVVDVFEKMLYYKAK